LKPKTLQQEGLALATSKIQQDFLAVFNALLTQLLTIARSKEKDFPSEKHTIEHSHAIETGVETLIMSAVELPKTLLLHAIFSAGEPSIWSSFYVEEAIEMFRTLSNQIIMFFEENADAYDFIIPYLMRIEKKWDEKRSDDSEWLVLEIERIEKEIGKTEKKLQHATTQLRQDIIELFRLQKLEPIWSGDHVDFKMWVAGGRGVEVVGDLRDYVAYLNLTSEEAVRKLRKELGYE